MNKAEERSKEIMQAALDYANNLDDIKPTDVFKRYLCIALGQAFIKGAEWADSHQAEKDLADAFIEKASEWIKNKADKYIVDTPLCSYFDYKRAIEDFKEYMKGE